MSSHNTDLAMVPSTSALTGQFSQTAPSVIFNNRGALFGTNIRAGGNYILDLRGKAKLSSTVSLSVRYSQGMQSSSSLSSIFKDSNSLSMTFSSKGRLTSSISAFVIFNVLSTEDLVGYKVRDNFQTHTEQAENNLIMEFKHLPNITKFLEMFMKEFDKTSLDVRDIQEFVISLEEAEGVNLDTLGEILGRRRIFGENDIVYRAMLLSQVQVITCDGTLRKILVSILMRYNYSIDEASKDVVSLRTLAHNIVSMYIYNYNDILNNGGVEFLQELIAAGSGLVIKVNDPLVTKEGEYFTLDNDLSIAFHYDGYEWPLSNLSPMPLGIQEFLDLTGNGIDIVQDIDNVTPNSDELDNIAVHGYGTFLVTNAGEYTFKLESQDGSNLYIDGTLRVNNDDGTIGSLQTTEGTVYLTKGMHLIASTYFHRQGIERFDLTYKGPDTSGNYSLVQPYVEGLTEDLVGSGLGLGSEEAPESGGSFVGEFNQDPNGQILIPFGLLDSTGTLGLDQGQFVSGEVLESSASPVIYEGLPTPTTTSTIAVPTYPI